MALEGRPDQTCRHIGSICGGGFWWDCVAYGTDYSMIGFIAIGLLVWFSLKGRDVFAVKQGPNRADIRFTKPELAQYRMAIAAIMKYHADQDGLPDFEPTITSGAEGEHKTGSLHYKYLAEDWRIWTLKDGEYHWLSVRALEAIRADIRTLDPNLDVVIHPKSHIHVEYDKKDGIPGVI